MNPIQDIACSNLPDTSQLTSFEVLFLTEYILNGNNGRQAYLKLKPHVTENTATSESSDLVRKPASQRYLQEYKDSLTIKACITKDKLIQYSEWGLEKCKEQVELGTLFKGIEVTGKLIGAYESDQDDLSKYTGLLNKITAKNVQININNNA